MDESFKPLTKKDHNKMSINRLIHFNQGVNTRKNCLGFFGISEIFGIFIEKLGFFGIFGIFWDFWDFLGFSGIFWDFLELFSFFFGKYIFMV